MEKKRLNVEVPSYVNELLNEESEKSGMSKSAIVNVSIQKYLGLFDSHKKTPTYEEIYFKMGQVVKKMEKKLQNENKK